MTQTERLKNAFIFALVLKIIFSIASLFAFTWELGFGVPLAVMLGYMVYGYYATKTQNRSLRLKYGDSCYYLGFLFTVASLSFALIDIGLKGELTVVDVAIRFGAAMFTTLLGMGMRVLLFTFADDAERNIPVKAGEIVSGKKPKIDEPGQQVSPQSNKQDQPEGVYVSDEDGTEFIINVSIDNLRNLNNALAENVNYSRRLRENLELMCGRVSNDLTEATNKVAEYGNTLMKLTEDSINKSHEAHQKHLEKEYELIHQQMSELINKNTEQCNALMNSVNESNETHHKLLEELIRNNAEHTKKMADETLDLVSAAAKSTLSDLKDDLKSISENLNSEIQSRIEDTDNIARTSVENINALAKGAINGIASTGEQVAGDISRSMSDTSDQLKAICNRMEQDRDKFASSSKAITDNLNNATLQIIKTVDDTCQSFSKIVQHTEGTVKQQVSGIGDGLNRIDGSLNSISRNAEDLNREVKQTAEQLNRSVESLSSEVENFEEKMKELQPQKRKRFFGLF